MRGFFASMFCTIALVGVAMQFERPTATAGLAEVTTKAPSHEDKAASPAATVTPEPVQYELVKVCDGNRCHYERRPIANAAKRLAGVVRGENCNCGCGCANCNCGVQPVQQTSVQSGEPVRRGLFGRRSGRLFGGRLFGGGRLFNGGGLFGGGCCR